MHTVHLHAHVDVVAVPETKITPRGKSALQIMETSVSQASEARLSPTPKPLGQVTDDAFNGSTTISTTTIFIKGPIRP